MNVLSTVCVCLSQVKSAASASSSQRVDPSSSVSDSSFPLAAHPERPPAKMVQLAVQSMLSVQADQLVPLLWKLNETYALNTLYQLLRIANINVPVGNFPQSLPTSANDLPGRTKKKKKKKRGNTLLPRSEDRDRI